MSPPTPPWQTDLDQAIIRLERRSRTASTPAEHLGVLRDIANGHRVLATLRDRLSDLAALQTVRALRAGVDLADVIDEPFSDTTVRKIAREAGVEVPRRRPGPAPRQLPKP